MDYYQMCQNQLLAIQSEALGLIMVASQIAAAIALWVGILTALGQSKVAVATIEGIARNPEAKGSLSSSMFVGMGLCETAGIYGLVISFLLIFVNPLVSQFIGNVMGM